MIFRSLACGACIIFILAFDHTASAAVSDGASPRHLTAYDDWKAPAGARRLCDLYGWACADRPAAGLRRDDELLSTGREVNAEVNRRIEARSDADLYGVGEKWTLPSGGRGDCEDYALLKMKKLLERGVASDRLLLSVVIDESYIPHVVLVLRTREGDYFLDNMTGGVLPWHLTGYTVLTMQNPADKSAWSAVFLGELASREGRERAASWSPPDTPREKAGYAPGAAAGAPGRGATGYERRGIFAATMDY